MRRILLLSTFVLSLISGPLYAQGPQSISSVPTLAALRSAPTSQFKTSVLRQGYLTPGDGGEALYKPSSSPCSLNTGNGDNGSQVRSADGKCWIGYFSAGVDVRIFGALPGVADASIGINAAGVYVNTILGGGDVVIRDVHLTVRNPIIWLPNVSYSCDKSSSITATASTNAIVQTATGAPYRLNEVRWRGCKLYGGLLATHIFDLKDFQMVWITDAYLVNVNGSYVKMGDAAQSAATFGLHFVHNVINRESATAAPVGNYGIESAGPFGSGNDVFIDNEIIGTSIGIYGPQADFFVDSNHFWTDPFGGRGDMLHCAEITAYGANYTNNQCDFGTQNFAGTADLYAYAIDVGAVGFVNTFSNNRINSTYGANNHGGAFNLATNVSLTAFANVFECTGGHAFLTDFNGSTTNLNAVVNNGIGCIQQPSAQMVSVQNGAVMVGGARIVPRAGSTNNGLLFDFGGLGGANAAGINAYDYGTLTSRDLHFQDAGGLLFQKNLGPSGGGNQYGCVNGTTGQVFKGAGAAPGAC
jgi:hypothetical protein